MQIIEVINRMKAYHKGGEDIREETTRDKILYGNPYQECTGIVTTCWANIDVIKKAHELGANLIICHEALFWNHGDHTEWLLEQKNATFLEKKALLDQTDIVVWRDHDYIHSGIPMADGTYTDGIFYGFAKLIGWDHYIVGNVEQPLMYEIPETTVQAVAQLMMDKFHLNGAKVLGNPNTKVKRVYIPAHIMGPGDSDVITKVDAENIDLLLPLELIDYTVSEYIRDSGLLGKNKAILTVGHFNAEEPGMEYMLNYIPEAVGENIPCHFVQSGDNYEYYVDHQ